MAGTGKNVIFAGRSSNESTNLNPQYVEALAAEAISPGDVVVLDATGKFALKTATADPVAYVADLNSLKQGGVSDDWETGETVVSFLPRDGEYYNVRVIDAQNLVKDTPLKISATAGSLEIGVPGTDAIIFYSDEAVVTTADKLVRVKKI